MDQRRLTSEDFDPELWAIFDDYVHGHIDRRGFLDRAARFAVGGMTAAIALMALTGLLVATPGGMLGQSNPALVLLAALPVSSSPISSRQMDGSSSS